MPKVRGLQFCGTKIRGAKILVYLQKYITTRYSGFKRPPLTCYCATILCSMKSGKTPYNRDKGSKNRIRCLHRPIHPILRILRGGLGLIFHPGKKSSRGAKKSLLGRQKSSMSKVANTGVCSQNCTNVQLCVFWKSMFLRILMRTVNLYRNFIAFLNMDVQRTWLQVRDILCYAKWYPT